MAIHSSVAPVRRILLTSIPKCGTHLMVAYLESMGFRRYRIDTLEYRVALAEQARLLRQGYDVPELKARIALEREKVVAQLRGVPTGALVADHFQFDPTLADSLRELGYVVLFMYRDPRDQLISYRNHVLREPGHKNYARFARNSLQQTLRELIIGAPAEIPGESNVTSVELLFSQFEPWFTAAGVYSLAFEHLVGAKGNGSRLRQLYEADHLCQLVAPEAADRVDDLVRAMFDEKHSLFVKGQIGVWRGLLDAENQRLFAELVAPGLSSFLERIEGGEPLGWDRFILDARNLRRAWRAAERDLAEMLALRSSAQSRLRALEKKLFEALQDSDKRLAVIRRFEARVANLEARLLEAERQTQKRSADSAEPAKSS